MNLRRVFDVLVIVFRVVSALMSLLLPTIPVIAFLLAFVAGVIQLLLVITGDK